VRVYFLSYKPAILKLNGLYVGGIDTFERHIEIDLSDSVLAEIVPGENLQPVNFFINEKLLFEPPAFMDVYLMDGETLIFIKEYGNKSVNLSVIAQTRFCGNLAETLLRCFRRAACFSPSRGRNIRLFPCPKNLPEQNFPKGKSAVFPFWQ